ncbi:SusD-like starch-binding protein associating with outer membrane [Tenacibaculum skagerrakense]|uniref:SusD-like starch-binding protein associating with outer membrane n=1 Tax=Tenacibaculum skagerrakense TaxID=186571 RepID=A0A4V2SMC0_9FLAO|nr:RagB/SusD family nutrient uptake outer membrane protein [Tenacibaculum skagerrakense]TCP26686.1 SusD-like starch-binding protein associating with outer membrane [Tenacibaculum skagerrakense]
MKKIKILFAATLLAVSYSCSDELLRNDGVPQESQPTTSLTSVQLEQGAETNLAIPAAFVSGMYAQMVQTGSGGTTGHDDFGHKSYDVFGDMMSGDMALSLSTFGWYRASITELQAMEDFTFGDNRQVWRYYYRIVRSANTIIQNLGGNDAIPATEEGRYSMGQAKAMRAHSYFYLTQYYQKEYNPSEPILPMPIGETSGNLPKSTAEEVYDRMEQDLTDAISLLSGFNRTAKSAVNQDVARMLLAYVLGAKGGRDTDVASLTQDVISSGNYAMLGSADVTNGFNDVNSPSWMWGIDITPELGLGLISWWGQIDAYSFSYAWAGDYKAIDETLFSAIPANDARKAQFLDQPANGRHLQPLLKFYWNASVAGSTSYGSGPNPGVTADYVYMRVEEAYLLNAEANAKAGNEGTARASLKALVSRRVPDASYVDALSGQALLDEIYLQTRIELWGEGKSFLALKRNKRTATRGTNHLSLVGVGIPYNDERFQFEIPQDEIQNNPFVTGQNL